jgi:hypothetical protein
MKRGAGGRDEYPHGKQISSDEEGSKRAIKMLGKPTTHARMTVSAALLLALTRTAQKAAFPAGAEARRRAKEDSAMAAEGIVAQAEEANALDPVG